MQDFDNVFDTQDSIDDFADDEVTKEILRSIKVLDEDIIDEEDLADEEASTSF